MAEPVQIPIEYFVPEDMPTLCPNNLVVRHTDDEFTLLFFEAREPIIVGSEDEKREALAQVTSVRARCVARIVLSPKKMFTFAEAIQRNIERFQALVAEASE